jgi:response regulator RpfG family c-di-GMP phosphodiesterase
VKLYIKFRPLQNGPKTRSVILGEGIHMTDDNKIISIVGEELGKAQVFDDSLRTIKGINVLKFTDSVVALEHLKINKDDYALMISDLRMPVINGLQLLTTVKDLNPSARTVLTTDFEYDNKLIQECTNRHIINGFIQKPVEPHELVTEINKQIDIIESINKK